MHISSESVASSSVFWYDNKVIEVMACETMRSGFAVLYTAFPNSVRRRFACYGPNDPHVHDHNEHH